MKSGSWRGVFPIWRSGFAKPVSDGRQFILSARDPDNGSGQHPDHPVEKSLALEGQRDQRTFADHRDPRQRAHRALRRAAVGGEAAEIVPSDERCGCASQEAHVEVFRNQPDLIGLQRQGDALVPDEVPVNFSFGGMLSVKVFGGFLAPQDADRGGEVEVQDPLPLCGGEAV